MAIRECKTCAYIQYNETEQVVGYECSLCGKYVEGRFKSDNCEPKIFTEDEFPELKRYLTNQLNNRKGYKYWCPLVKHTKNTN